jgi:hypothetical protein
MALQVVTADQVARAALSVKVPQPNLKAAPAGRVEPAAVVVEVPAAAAAPRSVSP